MRLNDSKPCGKCKACTRFNGQNWSGYQPCHNIKKLVNQNHHLENHR